MTPTRHDKYKTRVEMADLCNELGIRIAAEVGTDTGVFAVEFLNRWSGDLLLCIDPYDPYEEMDYDRLGDLLVAVQALSHYHGRVKFIKHRSPEIVDRLPECHRPGFVYIDGSHVYESAKADVVGWWRYLRSGDVLAGHDYDEGHPGVQRAVDELAIEYDLSVSLTSECLPSWFVQKP